MISINELFRRILARRPSSRIGDGAGSTFFIRYDLIKTRWGALYLHEFLRSDSDRCLHDHPWPFATLILRAGYWEEMPGQGFDPYGKGGLNPTEKVWRRPGYFGRYPAKHAHRIEIDPAKPQPWSLVWVGKRERKWGFWTARGWVPWVNNQSNPICETPR